MVTLKERFASLTGRGWRLQNGQLRCAKGFCPILALADAELCDGKAELDGCTNGMGFVNSFYTSRGIDLGIPTGLVDQIANTADGHYFYEAQQLLAPLFEEAKRNAY